MINFMEANNLTRNFNKLIAVNKINFHIRTGEILGILGPNGAGKSTTISMLSSLLAPTSGDILLNGESILKDNATLRRILGVVPQDIALYPDLSGQENLEFFGRAYGLRGGQLKQRINEVLNLVGLTEKKNQLVASYSGGMKRRINIGCALMHDPKLLIMDEPTVGIDPQSRNHILETVKQLNQQGMTIIYTSHYMEEVELLCQRIYIMDHGQIIATGTKDELKALVASEYTIEVQVALIKDSFLTKIKELSWVKETLLADNIITIIGKKNDNGVTEVFKLASDMKIELCGINIKTPTLEDVFLSLTGRGLRN
ncbi:MAG: ABC transporter ATP-binding protein [Bacillota bacterium]|nr:ABC transporter ATP-binding protein [Bacillota bacterium]